MKKNIFIIGLLLLVGSVASHAQQKAPAKAARVVVINKADGKRDTLLMSDVDRITFGYSDQVVESPAEADSVDLGLSVKWASFNLGAKAETETGFLVGWGDNTAVNQSENLNFYPQKTAPSTLVGTEYDLAQLLWENNWRMPTDLEFKALIDSCTWAWEEDNQGFRVTGVNGNSIFLPATGYRHGSSSVEAEALNGYYWTGMLSDDTRQAWAVKVCQDEEGNDTAFVVPMERYLGLAIRPVHGNYVLPIALSASLYGTPGYRDAQVTVTFSGEASKVDAFGLAYQKAQKGEETVDMATAAKVEKTGAPSGEQVTFSLEELDEGTDYLAVAYAVLGTDTVKSVETVAFTTDVRYVDLGLSVKWAKWNIGAESENEYGGYYGWGDPTGELASPYANNYAVGNTSTNIAGSKYDIATAKWGSHWRLPTRAEYEELIEASGGVWTLDNSGGVQKYIATFPNGETLALPFRGYMTSTLSELAHEQHGYYWTAEATTSQEPYALHFSSPRARSFQTSEKSLHVFVRAVYDDGSAEPGPSDPDDPDDPEEKETDEAGKAVDLGLYSGTLWATYNVGAKDETEAGMYVAWGELREKIDEGYFQTNYAYLDANNTQYGGYSTALGLDIAGTEYDLAHVRWGGNWTMPTDAEAKELRDDCTWSQETRKGVFGYKVTGPNGNSIFLPCPGYYNGNNFMDQNIQGIYWCSTMYMFAREYQMGYTLTLHSENGYELSRLSRKSGCIVRPVKHVKK